MTTTNIFIKSILFHCDDDDDDGGDVFYHSSVEQRCLGSASGLLLGLIRSSRS